MTQGESPSSLGPDVVPAINGQAEPISVPHIEEPVPAGSALPPQAVKMLMELTEMRANFGPDPETTKILAETERRAEEAKLEGYKATLQHRDSENQRKHERLKMKIKNEAMRSWAVLVASITAAVAGVFFAVTGRSNLGIPLLLFAGIMIKDLAGKPSSSVDLD